MYPVEWPGGHIAGNQHKQRTNQHKEKGGGHSEKISFVRRACSSMELKHLFPFLWFFFTFCWESLIFTNNKYLHIRRSVSTSVGENTPLGTTPPPPTAFTFGHSQTMKFERCSRPLTWEVEIQGHGVIDDQVLDISGALPQRCCPAQEALGRQLRT